MSNHTFDNIYNLSSEHLEQLDNAEEWMVKNHLGAAAQLLLKMVEEEEDSSTVIPKLRHYEVQHIQEIANERQYYTID